MKFKFSVPSLVVLLAIAFQAEAQFTNTLTFTFNETARTEEEMYRFEPPGFNIDRTRKTILLIHGFRSNPTQAFASGSNTLVQALSTTYPAAHIIGVDWSSLMRGINPDGYNWVYNRMWFVGRRLAKLLEKDLSIDPDNTSIVAHSLGAHVAGTTGHTYNQLTKKKINEIVGLDAAGVLMGHLGGDVRLTKDDAKRVIAIHSSDTYWGDWFGSGVGWGSEYGDLDIYIFTNKNTGDGTFQLLGSGPGDGRNQHGYATDLYRDFVSKNKYNYANKWTWDNADFDKNFELECLDSLSGTITVKDAAQSNTPRDLDLTTLTSSYAYGESADRILVETQNLVKDQIEIVLESGDDVTWYKGLKIIENGKPSKEIWTKDGVHTSSKHVIRYDPCIKYELEFVKAKFFGAHWPVGKHSIELKDFREKLITFTWEED